MHYFIIKRHTGETNIVIGSYTDLVIECEKNISSFSSIEEIEPQKLDNGDAQLYIVTSTDYQESIVEFDSFETFVKKVLIPNCENIESIEDWQSS